MKVKLRFASGKEYTCYLKRKKLKDLYFIKEREGLEIYCLCNPKAPPMMTIVKRRGRYHLRTFPDQKIKHSKKCRYFRNPSRQGKPSSWKKGKSQGA